MVIIVAMPEVRIGNGDLTDGARQGSDWWSGSTQQMPAFLILHNIAVAVAACINGAWHATLAIR